MYKRQVLCYVAARNRNGIDFKLWLRVSLTKSLPRQQGRPKHKPPKPAQSHPCSVEHIRAVFRAKRITAKFVRPLGAFQAGDDESRDRGNEAHERHETQNDGPQIIPARQIAVMEACLLYTSRCV